MYTGRVVVESDHGGLLIEFAEIFHRLLDAQIRGLHEWEWNRNYINWYCLQV